MLLAKFRSCFSIFHRNSAGNVMITFALAMVPILLSAGMAVDYTRISRDISDIQNAMDSATLAAAGEIEDKTDAQLKTLIDDFLKVNLEPRLYNQIANQRPTIDRTNLAVKLDVTAESPTTFLKITNRNTIDYDLIASTKTDVRNAEVILALDTTYSMSQENRMTDLKYSANKFVDELMKHNRSTTKVKIGIVPFARYVNVGLGNRNQPWMSVPADRTEVQPRRCTTRTTGQTCIGVTTCTNRTGYNDGVPYTYRSCSCSRYSAGTTTTSCYTPTYTYTWHGCVGSRPYPYNLKAPYDSRKFTGLQNVTCANPLLPLSDNKATVKNQIQALNPSGDTYIPAGLMWGMRLVTSSQPFTQAVTFAEAQRKNTKKVVILMTDGENTRSKDGSNPTHNGSDTNQTNRWTTEACNEIKSKNIELYTLTFGRSVPAATKSLIKQCATSDEHYFDATTGTDLTTAFDKIAANLTRLRLTQ